MDKFKTKDILGGLPRVLDDLRHLTGQDGGQGMYQALNNLLGSFGTNFVVTGCEVTGTAPNQVLSEGWIIYNSELLRVDAATGLDTGADPTFTKAITFKGTGLKNLQSGGTGNTYEQNRGVLSGSGGSLNVLEGLRYKDQFDEWKRFDVTNTNANLIANDEGFGTGSDVDLNANSVNSYFKYRKVGNTVNWALNLDFHLDPFNTVGEIKSLVIKNLPWTSKDSQTQQVRFDCWSNSSFISHSALLSQQNTEDKMTITIQMFTKAATIINQAHTWATTPSMNVSVDGTSNGTLTRWIVRGSGTFEAE